MIAVWRIQFGYIAQEFKDTAVLDKYKIDMAFAGVTSSLAPSLAEAVESLDPRAMKAYLWEDDGRRGNFVEVKL